MTNHPILLAAASALTLLVCTVCEAGPISGETSRSLCFELAAERSAVPESLLRAVAKVESNFRPEAIHYDSDGTYDVGVMQINSSHFPELASRYHITEQMLLERPCVNIFVGAKILGAFLRQYRGTWRGIGSYGAGTSPAKEHARMGYASLVARALSRRWHVDQVAVVTQARAQRRMVVIE